jgi:hypothetical protein
MNLGYLVPEPVCSLMSLRSTLCRWMPNAALDKGIPFLSPSLPCLTILLCLFLLQHHPGPPPVPLGDCRGPVQTLRLYQCPGAGRQLHELRCHPARDPGPSEGAPGLLSFLPLGEDAGDCWLYLCHPHHPPCGLRAALAGEAAEMPLLTQHSMPSPLWAPPLPILTAVPFWGSSQLLHSPDMLPCPDPFKS